MPDCREIDVSTIHRLDVLSEDGLRVDVRAGEADGSQLLRGQFDPQLLVGTIGRKGRHGALVPTFWAGPYLATRDLTSALEEEGLRGWRSVGIPIVGEQPDSMLDLLVITGRIGPAFNSQRSPLPGLPALGWFVDPAAWDGSDLFLADNHDTILMTANAAAKLRRHHLRNVSIQLDGLEPWRVNDAQISALPTGRGRVPERS